MTPTTVFPSRSAGVRTRQLVLTLFGYCLFAAVAGANLAYGQSSLLCIPSASPSQVRSEGITERVGAIVLSCSGGVPGYVISGNLTFFLNVNITNKLAANNTFTDVLLTIDTGSGPTPVNVSAQPFGTVGVAFNGVSFTVPPSGNVTIELSNLRADASQLGTAPNQPIVATIAFSGSQGFAVSNNAEVTVGFTLTGLLATFSSSGVTCTGSPLPSLLNIGNLFAVGTRFFSTRITEGFASSFQVKDAFSDTGTRFIVSYSGFPAGAQLFVPDYVAGSDAVVPTSGGDLGLLPSGGTYSPSATGSLLLILVSGADQNGAGGSMAFPKPPFALTPFNGVTPVPLVNGAGAAVYEVADTNPNIRESAQFPTFLGLAPFSNGSSTTAYVNLSFAPVSTVHVASDQPVPRFISIAPPSDCSALGDCNASYFPHLQVEAPTLNFAAAENAFLQTEYVQVHNTGQGELNWTASVTYQSGSGWLTIDPASGLNDATIRVDALPSKVLPGTYQATLTVDAGPLAGSQSFPVTFTVTGPSLGGPLITSVVNAASLAPGPLVPGSLAAIFGSNLTGEQVSVTFGGTPATLLYTAPTQINLQVPVSLAGQTSSQLMVTVNGQSSAPQAVTLAVAAPGIFNPGILNQNGTLNTAANPAARGTTVEILCTGLISPGSGAVSAVVAGGPTFAERLSAGPVAGIPGVQEVTVPIPASIPAGATQVEVCAVATDPNQPVCSLPASVMVK